MDEKEKFEDEGYKKRIKDLIDSVEKGKDIPEGYQQILEAKEMLLRTTISRIHPSYRNERIILILSYLIRDYYRRGTDPNEKEQFQEEIDYLFKLIYEELKKPSLYFPNLNPYRKKTADYMEKRRILDKMIQVLGVEKINQFYEECGVGQLNSSGSRWKNDFLTDKQKVHTKMIIFEFLNICYNQTSHFVLEEYNFI